MTLPKSLRQCPVCRKITPYDSRHTCQPFTDDEIRQAELAATKAEGYEAGVRAALEAVCNMPPLPGLSLSIKAIEALLKKDAG